MLLSTKKESIKLDLRLVFSSVQFSSLSHVQLFMTPWTAAQQASLSMANSPSLLKLMSIESVMPFNHLILFHPLSSHLQSLLTLGTFPVSQFFTAGGQSIGVSASASVLPKNIQYLFILGLTDWISLQSKGLSNLLQHHSSKASILQCSYPYMTTGKTIALTRWTFVGKGRSLLRLSWLVITFLPRSMCLLISWLQSPYAVILERPPLPAPLNKVTVSIVFSSICHEMMGLNAMILVS